MDRAREDAAWALAGERAAAESKPLRRVNVLVVDDDPAILRMLGQQIRHFGHTPWLAESVEAGMAVLERERVEVAIIDYALPRSTGAAMISEMHVRYPDVVVLLHTASSQFSAAVDCTARGNVFRFLAKPTAMEDLARAIDDADGEFEQRQMRRMVYDFMRTSMCEFFERGVRRTERRGVATVVEAQWEAAVEAAGRSGLLSSLSRREVDVCRAIASQPEVDAVSNLLGISPHTVRNHIKSIYRKLDVHSREELRTLILRGRSQPESLAANE